MLKFFAFILLLALTAQTFQQGIYYVDYLVDKTAYAKNCVNKKRPKLHCQGKCQLMKKMQEEEEKQAPQLKIAKTEQISSRSWFTTAAPRKIIITGTPISVHHDGSPVDQPSSFFHPPSA